MKQIRAQVAPSGNGGLSNIPARIAGVEWRQAWTILNLFIIWGQSAYSWQLGAASAKPIGTTSATGGAVGADVRYVLCGIVI